MLSLLMSKFDVVSQVQLVAPTDFLRTAPSLGIRGNDSIKYREVKGSAMIKLEEY